MPSKYRAARFAKKNNLIGLLHRAMLHAGRSYRHPGDSKAARIGFFFQ